MRSHILKKAFSQAFAILISVLVSYFFAFSEKYWMLLATLLVMQTSIGITLRQGLQRWLCLLAGMIGGTYVRGLVPDLWHALSMGMIVFCGSYCLQKNNRSWVLSSYFIFSMFFLFSLLVQVNDPVELHYRVYDAAIGGAIGMIANLFIFPSRVDVEFRQDIVPIFSLYSEYLNAITQLMMHKPDAEKLATEIRNTLEMKLQKPNAYFPVWIYEPGLSISLQSGHRHFLIMVERISEILFSLHYEARREWDAIFLTNLEHPINLYVEEVKKVLGAIATVLSLKKLNEPVGDMKEEMLAVENAFNEIVPSSSDLLNNSDDYLRLAAVIENLKDLRITLINLGNALRASLQQGSLITN